MQMSWHTKVKFQILSLRYFEKQNNFMDYVTD